MTIFGKDQWMPATGYILYKHDKLMQLIYSALRLPDFVIPRGNLAIDFLGNRRVLLQPFAMAQPCRSNRDTYVPRSRPPVQASIPALQDTHFNLTSVLKTPFSTKTEEKCIFKPIFINFQLFWPYIYAGKSVLGAVTRRKISSLDPLLPQNPFPKPLSWKTRNAHTYQFFFRVPPILLDSNQCGRYRLD